MTFSSKSLQSVLKKEVGVKTPKHPSSFVLVGFAMKPIKSMCGHLIKVTPRPSRHTIMAAAIQQAKKLNRGDY